VLTSGSIKRDNLQVVKVAMMVSKAQGATMVVVRYFLFCSADPA